MGQYVIAGAALAVVVSMAHGSVLTFDFGGGNGTGVPQEYGDRITSGTMGSFSYGTDFGFTPNITADYLGTGGVNHWTTDYGDLSGIAYAEGEGGNIFSITLQADLGFAVALHGFDMGGWPSTDYRVDWVRVYAGEAGNLGVVFEQTNALIRGSTVDDQGRRHTSFDFSRPIVGTFVVVEFNAASLGGGGDNVGIDNVAFEQVPAPASLGMMLMGGVAAGRRRRS